MEKLFFEPFDTLFFRDGRPFNQGEGNAGIESLFPPSPLTMVGAARAAWARALGWKGKKKWKDEIKTDLGGDEKELKGLKFYGPLLYNDKEPLFPIPALLLNRQQGKQEHPQSIIRLRPSDKEMECDLGKVRLPEPDIKENGFSATGQIKELKGWWLNKRGMGKVLNGEKPEPADFIRSSKLWSYEPKVGNQIDRETRTVEEHMLYSTIHVRLHPKVRLMMGVEGELEEFEKFPNNAQVPLGGEARSCYLTKESGALDLPDSEVDVINGKVRYAVFVLTPLNPKQPPRAGQSFENLPGKVVSACMPRAQRWGGWDTINFQPLPMKPHLAPGSVIFMEADEKYEDILNYHGKTVGERSSWGFGLIAIGKWN